MLTPSPMVRKGSFPVDMYGKLAATVPAATAFAVVPINSRRVTADSLLVTVRLFILSAIFVSSMVYRVKSTYYDLVRHNSMLIMREPVESVSTTRK